MSDLQSEPGFSELAPRQQARLYSSRIETNQFSTFMQLCRVGRLDLSTARKILKDPATLPKINAA